jgi:hypothetical protein
MGELIDRDVEHLRLLHIGFYIMAGLAGFFSLFALIYIGLGAAVVAGVFSQFGNSSNAALPAAAFGWIFVGIGMFVLVLGLTMALLLFLTGKNLQQHHHRTFCMVMAGLCCLQVPWGTAIGICAINVLNRPSVIAMFKMKVPPPLG